MRIYDKPLQGSLVNNQDSMESRFFFFVAHLSSEDLLCFHWGQQSIQAMKGHEPVVGLIGASTSSVSAPIATVPCRESGKNLYTPVN